MRKHEDKYCPRCNELFECKPDNITQCQCFGFSFTNEEKLFIEKNYSDCLCSACLTELKNEFTAALKQLPLQKK